MLCRAECRATRISRRRGGGCWLLESVGGGKGCVGGEELLKWSNGRGVRRLVWERGVRCAHDMLGKKGMRGSCNEL